MSANCVRDLVPVVQRLLSLPEANWQASEEDVVRSVLSRLEHLPLSFAHFDCCELAQRLSAKAATHLAEEDLEGFTVEERTEKEERWCANVAAEMRAVIEKDTVRVDEAALLETRLTSSSSAAGQFQSFSFFDFDDLPPLESLEEVLQGLRGGHEEAWQRLLRFEHLDLLEHPQWREVPPLLRTALQSVAAAVREQREPPALTLTLYALCCRFLQAFAEHPQCAEVLQTVAEHCLLCFHADRERDCEEEKSEEGALTHLASLSQSLLRESAALLALYAQLCVSLVSSSSCLGDETSNGVARLCILSFTQGCVTSLCGERRISLLAVVCASHTLLPVALSLLQQCDVVMLHEMERKHALLAVVDRALTVCFTQHSSPHTQLTQHNLSCGLLAVRATLRSRLSQRLSHNARPYHFHSIEAETETHSDAYATAKKQRYENVPLSLLRRVLSESALLSEPHVDAHWTALVRSLVRLVQSSSERDCARDTKMSTDTETETMCGILAEMTLSLGRERGAEGEAFRECTRLLSVVSETVSLPEPFLSALTGWIETHTQTESSLRVVLRNLRRRERQRRPSISFPAVYRLVRKVCRAATPAERDVTQLTTVTRECVLWAATASHSELLALSRTVLDRLQRDPFVFENEHETLSWSNDRSAALLLFELVFSLVALHPTLTQGLQIVEPEKNGEEEDLLAREPYTHRWDCLFAVRALRWLSRDSHKVSPEQSCLVAVALSSINTHTEIADLSPATNQSYFKDVSGQMRHIQLLIDSNFGVGCGIDPQALLRINSKDGEPAEVDGLRTCVVSMSNSVEQAQRMLRDIEQHCELDVFAAAEVVVQSLQDDVVLTAESLLIDCGLLALFLFKNWFAPFVNAVEMQKITCEFIVRRYDLSFLVNIARHEIERIVIFAHEQEIVGFENLLCKISK